MAKLNTAAQPSKAPLPRVAASHAAAHAAASQPASQPVALPVGQPMAQPVLPELSAERFRALSEPTRLRILALLQDGEHCVCDLQSALDIAQPLLSFHLKALRDAGFVHWRKQGRWAYYTICNETLSAAHDDLARLRATGVRRSLPTACCE